MNRLLFIGLALLGLLPACGEQQQLDSATALPAGFEPCTEPRPEVCTLHYQPVCGYFPAASAKTYSNACSACADTAVLGWKAEACAEQAS